MLKCQALIPTRVKNFLALTKCVASIANKLIISFLVVVICRRLASIFTLPHIRVASEEEPICFGQIEIIKVCFKPVDVIRIKLQRNAVEITHWVVLSFCVWSTFFIPKVFHPSLKAIVLSPICEMFVFSVLVL